MHTRVNRGGEFITILAVNKSYKKGRGFICILMGKEQRTWKDLSGAFIALRNNWRPRRIEQRMVISFVAETNMDELLDHAINSDPMFDLRTNAVIITRDGGSINTNQVSNVIIKLLDLKDKLETLKSGDSDMVMLMGNIKYFGRLLTIGIFGSR